MSTSLAFLIDPIDQPAALDPVERATWSMLRIRVGNRVVSRFWDRRLGEERDFLYVPAFPIAEWVVRNWWALLYEPIRKERLPRPRQADILDNLPWIQRHCLRAASSDLCLPSLYVFNDGRSVQAEWRPDEPGALPHMPGEFTQGGKAVFTPEQAAQGMGQLVLNTLDRVAAVEDERVHALRADWQAVRGADPEQVDFCIAAARLGIDPYDPDELTKDLASFIEDSLGDPDLPLTRDLTEAARPESVIAQWHWVREVTEKLSLGPGQSIGHTDGFSDGASPWDVGYDLAREIREHVQIEPHSRVDSVPRLAGHPAIGAKLRRQHRNHVPVAGIRAAIGWTQPGEVVVAGPQRVEGVGGRFLEARGLYLALFACRRSARLITDACTWDQQASRAFAAELLAPQAALIEELGESTDPADADNLASKFGVSPWVVSHQLENAGVYVTE